MLSEKLSTGYCQALMFQWHEWHAMEGNYIYHGVDLRL